LNGERIEMGACRLISEPNIDGYTRRLIFIEEIYDLESLFSKNKLVKLQSTFLNLPLLLAHKENILPRFKDFTADLTYDLNVHRSLFDSLDSEHASEPEEIRTQIQEAVINTEGKKFMGFLDEKLEGLEQIVRGFQREEHERHGFYFRKQLWPIILSAPFMARTNLKPRGYAGDSEMMSMLYSNSYCGNSTFEKLMHKHPVEHPGAQAVRNRRKFIAEAIPRIRSRWSFRSEEKMRILSVACGPACEIEDILLCSEDCARYQFTLLDQDRSALMEAARGLDQVERRLGSAIRVEYLNESVRTMLTTPNLKKRWGGFDVIYSMGLFDYLTPPVAAAVLTSLYQLLKPGGEMMIGNFHVSNPSKYYMEYWLDWVLYYRTEEEFLSLLKDTPSADARVEFDETGIQMFLKVTKP
jgi:extracellular factor (EF) 3-hydroxypalmitic acid methyl ester biosynthesis protein